MNNKPLYAFEILTTTGCNMDCTYCFEGFKPADNGIVNTNKEKYFESIRYIFAQDWFKNEYSGMLLTFWGGEPTMNNEIIMNVMNEFGSKENIMFYIYGNGFDISKYKQLIDTLPEDIIKKLQIQISYDGMVQNDKYRVTKGKKPTREKVLATFNYLTQQPLDSLNFKQTLPIEECKNMYDVWVEFRDLYYYYNAISTKVKHLNIGYSPTIDSFKILDNTYLDDFKKSIKKIAKGEIEFFQKNNHHLMTWFGGNDDRANCSTGSSMSIIDEDGSIYPCHGALYLNDKEKHKIGDFENMGSVTNARTEYKKNINKIEKSCQECVATTCLVCPTTIYGNSQKETMNEKWNDRSAHNLCDFYKFFGTVDRSVQYYLKKG